MHFVRLVARRKNISVAFSRNTVKHIYKNGWVYSCSYFYYNDGTIDCSIMVDDNTATEAQKELYNTLDAISAGIVENNSYLYGKKEHGKTETADVELKRLYSFLTDLEENNYGQYVVSGY